MPGIMGTAIVLILRDEVTVPLAPPKGTLEDEADEVVVFETRLEDEWGLNRRMELVQVGKSFMTGVIDMALRQRYPSLGKDHRTGILLQMLSFEHLHDICVRSRLSLGATRRGDLFPLSNRDGAAMLLAHEGALCLQGIQRNRDEDRQLAGRLPLAMVQGYIFNLDEAVMKLYKTFWWPMRVPPAHPDFFDDFAEADIEAADAEAAEDEAYGHVAREERMEGEPGGDSAPAYERAPHYPGEQPAHLRPPHITDYTIGQLAAAVLAAHNHRMDTLEMREVELLV